jgi:hypothetical protein
MTRRQRRTQAAVKVLGAVKGHPWLSKDPGKWALVALEEWLTVDDVERMAPEAIAERVMDRAATAAALAGFGILPPAWN